MSSIRLQVRKKLMFWSSLICAGVVAYGFGLYQGSQNRMQRTIASMQKPVPVEMPVAVLPANEAKAEINPQGRGTSALSNSLNNTQPQKSPPKSR